MSYRFQIDSDFQKQHQILYLEDANSSNSQFHASERTLEECEDTLKKAITRLGGVIIALLPVIFENPERYGYIIEYIFAGGARGQMPIAGLPIRRKTDRRVIAARKQALLVAANLMMASADAAQHTPLSNPLMLHLLIDGETTLAQMISIRKSLPDNFLLNPDS